MTITSLFDLRRQLAVYLGEKMPDCDILPTLPTIRQPLPADGTTLVLTVQKLRRAEGLLPACGALLLEVTLQVTACHRDDSDACEAALEQLAALTAGEDFPARVSDFQMEACEFWKSWAAFRQSALLTLYCELAPEADEEVSG